MDSSSHRPATLIACPVAALLVRRREAGLLANADRLIGGELPVDAVAGMRYGAWSWLMSCATPAGSAGRPGSPSELGRIDPRPRRSSSGAASRGAPPPVAGSRSASSAAPSAMVGYSLLASPRPDSYGSRRLRGSEVIRLTVSPASSARGEHHRTGPDRRVHPDGGRWMRDAPASRPPRSRKTRVSLLDLPSTDDLRRTSRATPARHGQRRLGDGAGRAGRRPWCSPCCRRRT